MILLRIVGGLLSITVALLALGSVWRGVRGRPRADDTLWGIIAIFAAVQAGWFIRWALGWAPVPHSDESAATMVGLQFFMALLCARTIWVRWDREGWRW